MEAVKTRTYPAEYTVADGENMAVFSGPAGATRSATYAASLSKPTAPDAPTPVEPPKAK